ncbi:unnamed protein product, partial [marine sediment metagenome]
CSYCHTCLERCPQKIAVSEIIVKLKNIAAKVRGIPEGYVNEPKIFKVVLEKLKVSPDEAIFVGDRLYDDIKGAKSVGMTAILKEKRPYTGEEEIVPDLVIKNISDLKLYL